MKVFSRLLLWAMGGILTLAAGVPAQASSLGTSPRAAIPADIQQIICVDYRALKDSPTAMALKARVLPDTLKQFENSLRGVGIDPDSELEQLAFASFRTPTNALQVVGVAQGTFQTKKVLRKLQLRKVKPLKYRSAELYPMSGMQMVFLDDSTLLFGVAPAVKLAIDARDGYGQSLNSNSQMTDMMSGVESGAVWSVLDSLGTQNMLRSALGDASKLADYDVIKKRLDGSRYTMDFNHGFKFDLDVLTSDSMTAASLSSLLKAGVLFRQMTGTPTEKAALDSVTVDSDSSSLKLHFKTDEKKFDSLLNSDLFAAVSH